MTAELWRAWRVAPAAAPQVHCFPFGPGAESNCGERLPAPTAVLAVDPRDVPADEWCAQCLRVERLSGAMARYERASGRRARA